MAKTISLAPGETVTLYRRSFSSVPVVYRFQARPLGADAAAGEVRVTSRQLVFPGPERVFPLEETNQVKAGYWDTFLTVTVTATTPIELIYRRSSLVSGWLLAGIGILAVAAAAVMLLTF